MKTRKLLLFSAVLFLAVVSCKKDAEVNKDTFKIEREDIEATTQSVRITGTYDYAGTIDGITLELGRQSDLIDADAYRALMEGTDFSVEVKNLRTKTTYYYRYSVDYGGKTPYRTDIKSFKTVEYNLPEVVSKEVVSVGVNRAEVSGEVVSDGGGDAVTLRGICWSTNHNPSVGDEYANAGEGIGIFTCELTNLQPEKTYYVRAFAGNSKGVSYGDELTFITLATGTLAEVHTLGISDNAMLQAIVNGEVTLEGTSAVLERGICYGKEHYPTTSGPHVSAGLGAGDYSCQLINLEANMTYYVRAYAINSMGIAYGEELSFVAMSETTAPVVTTNIVNGITQTSATGHGTVVSDGGVSVTRRGLCWSMEHNPTVDDTYADCGSGIGDFSGLMPHLTDMMTYYVRAYAENAIGMSYGEEVSFTVGQHEHFDIPTVMTFDVFGITETTAIGSGELMDDGGAEVYEMGLCWSTSHNPTLNDFHGMEGEGGGFFQVEMNNLTPGTVYYVRAYATNGVGTGYGDEVSFTTLQVGGVPSVMTSEVSDITETSVLVCGDVMEDGGYEVIETGFCIGTNPNPTVIDDNTVYVIAEEGHFCITITGLTPNTTYYVRAFAINDAGIAYGADMVFATLEEPSGGVFFVDFENGMPAGWIVIDDNNDGYTWCLTSDIPSTWTYYENINLEWYHGGTNAICSGSYISGVGALTPDEYLISPALNLTGSSQLSFWVAATDASYPADHFGVFISTSGTDPSDFQSVQEWTLTGKSAGKAGNPIASRDGNDLRLGTWYHYTVDLSAYAGSDRYIAFRHFNCADQYIMCLDDIELSNNRK